MPEDVVSTPAYPDDFAAFEAAREGKQPEAEPAKPATESAAPPAEESTGEAAKPAPESAPEEDQDEEQDQPDKPKGKGGFQRRIDKLTAKVHDLERQLAGKPAAQSAETEPKPVAPTTQPVAPRLSQFEDLEAYEAARDAYQAAMVQWELAKVRRAEEQKVQQEQQRKQAETFAERVKEAEKQHPDFQDVAFSEDVPYSPAMARIVPELEQGAEVAYFFGKNPEEAARISRLSDVAAAIEIGKIVAKIAAPPEKPKPVAATKAPKPPAVITGAGVATPSVYDAEFGSDYGRWEAERNRQLQRR